LPDRGAATQVLRMSRARPPLVLLKRPDRPLVRDYSHLWVLPPPLLPRRLPLVRLAVVLALIAVALLRGIPP
jgi:hypothetical protein